MRIMVVDDSVTMRRILKNALTQLGYDDFVEAGHGAEAIHKMEGVELIFTDWNMPEMDGLTFVQWVRGNQTYAKIPIVMVTTEGAKDDVMAAIKAGVNQYITKPFTADVIKEKLERALS